MKIVIDWIWAAVRSVNDWTPLVPVVYVEMNRVSHTLDKTKETLKTLPSKEEEYIYTHTYMYTYMAYT